MNLEQLKKEEQELYDLLRINLQKQKEIARTEFKMKLGFGVGDIIEWGKGIGQKRGEVISLPVVDGNVRPEVAVFNKDGKPGKRVTKLYSWDIETVKKIIL